jgi:MarR family transcriptional regulator, transcriptional regulator for hemolysin
MKSSEPREQIGRLIGETHRLWRARMNERLRPLGLSQARWMTLRALSRSGDPMSQMELAARIGVEPPTLVGILDGLARDGLATRRASTRDRRVKTIHLTAKALRKIEQIEQIAQRLRADITLAIDTQQLSAAVRVLEMVKDRLTALALDDKMEAASTARARRLRRQKNTHSNAAVGRA